MKTKSQTKKVEELGSRSALTLTSSEPSTATSAPTPEAKPDNRLPIDAEARKANRMLPTPKVLNLLLTTAPDVYRLAEVVGKWVWVTFKEQPAARFSARSAAD